MAEYKSLYHYLGKPAGGELGRKVANEATVRGLRLEKMDVDKDLVSSGFVYTYPVDFLDDYFNNEQQTGPTSLEDRVRVLEDKVNLLYPQLKSNKELEDDLPF